jgi:hypothetical protein
MKITSKKNNMYWKVGFITLVLLLTTGSALVAGQNSNGNDDITKIFTFTAPQIHQIVINNQLYDEVIMPDAQGAWKAGEPNLPAYGVSFLLPQGTTVANITIQPGTKIQLGSGFTVAPVEQPVKLSELTTVYAKGTTDPKIYSSGNMFPNTLFSSVGTYSFRGYNILIFLLYPVQYQPITGQLSYFDEMTVVIKTIQTGSINPLYRSLEKDRIEVTKKIDSLDSLSSYRITPFAPLTTTGYDLLILTTNALKEGFVPLKEAHEAQGLKTEIKTLTDISQSLGQLTPETIRDFIRNEYITNGINYVLIGGDSDIIPAKMLWVQAGQEFTTMPSDLYYGCLDGTFNYNNNDQWGEPHDGDGGGDVDLIAEVYVGRASVGDITETNNFVQKTISYMNTGGYSSGPALMVGEYLWGPPDYPVTFGDNSMDELINGSHANHYTTVGMPLNAYTFEKLYDHNWSGFDLNYPLNSGWPTAEIISRINNGVRFINHLGHSSTTYNMRMVPSDIQGLSNTVLPFVYSQGCYAGAFDEGDCMAEYFTVKTTHAAFAAIMCARYGWGTPGSTNGPSQYFNRYFWDAVFGKNITSIGKANQYSKEENLKRINGQCMRWCYYEMNLFGDPTLTFITRNNTPPEKPLTPSGIRTGTVGQSYTFNTTTTDTDGDTLYYKWSFGDGTFSAWLGPYNSGKQVSVTHNWLKWGNYKVQVKARDEHRSESNWSDPLPVKMPLIPRASLIEYILEFFEQHFPRLYVLLNKS